MSSSHLTVGGDMIECLHLHLTLGSDMIECLHLHLTLGGDIIQKTTINSDYCQSCDVGSWMFGLYVDNQTWLCNLVM